MAQGDTQGQSSKSRLHDRIDRDFRYHAPKPEQVETYNWIRDQAREFAQTLVDNVPEGRELSTALTRLEEAVMHANAGIARGGA